MSGAILRVCWNDKGGKGWRAQPEWRSSAGWRRLQAPMGPGRRPTEGLALPDGVIPESKHLRPEAQHTGPCGRRGGRGGQAAPRPLPVRSTHTCCWGTSCSKCRTSRLTLHTEINDGDRAETVKLLEENTGINFHDGSSNNSLDTTSRARATNSCTSKDTAK